MIDLLLGLAAVLAGGFAAQVLVWALSRGGIVIHAMIQIAFVFLLQLLCFFGGYVSGILRGRAVEAKRWRQRHQPGLSDLLIAARERDRRPSQAGPHLPPLPTAPRFRPDWSPCSQPPNDPPNSP